MTFTIAAVHAAAVLLSVASAQVYNASFAPYTVNKELLVWPMSTLVLSGESARWVEVPQRTEPCVCLQASQASGYGVLNFTKDLMQYEVGSCTILSLARWRMLFHLPAHWRWPPGLVPHRCLGGLLHHFILARWRSLLHLPTHGRWGLLTCFFTAA